MVSAKGQSGKSRRPLFASTRRLSKTKAARARRRAQIEKSLQASDASAGKCGVSNIPANNNSYPRKTVLVNEPRKVGAVQLESDSGVTVLRGSFHQGDPRFPVSSRGKQCMANAAMAVGMRTLFEPDTWTSKDIDAVLMAGDKLYRDTCEARPPAHSDEENGQYLTTKELGNAKLRLLSVEMRVAMCDLSFGHLVVDHSDNGLPNLTKALQDFVNSGSNGILTSNDISVAIFAADNSVWVFDPHCRDGAGESSSEGRACLRRFADTEAATDALLQLLLPLGFDGFRGRGHYRLTGVEIIRVDFIDDDVVMSDDDVHSEVSSEIARTDQASPDFSLPVSVPSKKVMKVEVTTNSMSQAVDFEIEIDRIRKEQADITVIHSERGKGCNEGPQPITEHNSS